MNSEVIGSALKFYKVTSYITGTFLMLLVIEMIIRYGFGLDLWLAGPNGFFTLEERGLDGMGLPNTGLNISTAILIVHGWLYVAYLFGDFRLWTLMRWSFMRFLIIAAGGVVPMLSFFTERHFSKIAEQELAEAATKKAGK
ncbi:DUF3817 domain-containing protein [Rhodoluna sp.]|jgi:hypothetical protein|uniref:DUF3817 domain-containing protein n=1 Tax=Rhodoluna sp. TaxID=1969481 RepID=UPI0025F56E47|nr:DUF3817 domain-containing protein [Rhodoluna sp.]